MPERVLAAELLAKLFHILGHPHRVRIIEELNLGSKDVSTLTSIIGISQSRMSQHLAHLKSFPLVTEHREGKHVIYTLKQKRLPKWILEGLDFISRELTLSEDTLKAIQSAKEIWRVKQS